MRAGRIKASIIGLALGVGVASLPWAIASYIGVFLVGVVMTWFFLDRWMIKPIMDNNESMIKLNAELFEQAYGRKPFAL